ncbi:TPA: hypothetical protein RTH71_001163 [Campylobacter jejuni]|nr:hypothetical protein [Campylobacter jejuni]HDZ5138703.1 hypothetical protein [Campylobacter jejuni]HDZ5155366.1 hypothetical protein [Campylobacter jejuni]
MQKLSIFFTILIIINITACDNKRENNYKNHPSKAKECKENETLSEDCINVPKVGVKPKNEENKHSLSTPTKSENEMLEALKQDDFTKELNQSIENNESIIILSIAEIPPKIYPSSKMKENNQSSIFNDDVNITQEKLP